jgi:hypothetical protein
MFLCFFLFFLANKENVQPFHFQRINQSRSDEVAKDGWM